ncbi:MAG: response regulator [Candidatus Omnitrophota bacterium]
MSWNKIRQWLFQRPRKVLAIEDNPVDQRVLVRAIRLAGGVPLIVSNAKDGLVMARAHQPSVIILDVYLPQKEGFDICRQIREDDVLKDISVMYFTVASSPESIMEGLKNGDLYVCKPFRMEDLVNAIRSMLIGRQRRKQLKEGV